LKLTIQSNDSATNLLILCSNCTNKSWNPWTTWSWWS